MGHSEEGTTRARMLYNDNIPMSLGQLVKSVEMTQDFRTDGRTDRQTDGRTNIFLNMIFLLIGTPYDVPRNILKKFGKDKLF